MKELNVRMRKIRLSLKTFSPALARLEVEEEGEVGWFGVGEGIVTRFAKTHFSIHITAITHLKGRTSLSDLSHHCA